MAGYRKRFSPSSCCFPASPVPNKYNLKTFVNDMKYHHRGGMTVSRRIRSMWLPLPLPEPYRHEHAIGFQGSLRVTPFWREPEFVQQATRGKKSDFPPSMPAGISGHKNIMGSACNPAETLVYVIPRSNTELQGCNCSRGAVVEGLGGELRKTRVHSVLHLALPAQLRLELAKLLNLAFRQNLRIRTSGRCVLAGSIVPLSMLL